MKGQESMVTEWAKGDFAGALVRYVVEENSRLDLLPCVIYSTNIEQLSLMSCQCANHGR